MVRAKFRCIEKVQSTSVGAYGDAKPVDTEKVLFRAVTGPGNESWSKWTPAGSLEITITNPEAVRQFEVGKDYFLDFTSVDSP